MKRLVLILALAALLLTLAGQDWDGQEFELAIHALTNQARQDAGLPALSPEAGLTDLARLHSRNMCLDGFFDHQDLDGLRVDGRQRRYDPQLLQVAIGENLFLVERSDRIFNPEQVVEGWLASPAHRENIMAPDFTHLGVGVFWRDERLYATQVFATPMFRIVGQLPPVFPQGSSYGLICQYLSRRPAEGFNCLLATPDPSARIMVGDNVYYEGMLPLELEWLDNSRFRLTLRFVQGVGDYSLLAGWGEEYFSGLMIFRAI